MLNGLQQIFSRRGARLGAMLVLAGFVASLEPAAAQTARSPSSSPGPSIQPALPPGGAGAGSGNYVITSAANESGTFVWIVDPIQRTLTLCKSGSATSDFSCSKKPLP
jgi:hypothetical protein